MRHWNQDRDKGQGTGAGDQDRSRSTETRSGTWGELRQDSNREGLRPGQGQGYQG